MLIFILPIMAKNDIIHNSIVSEDFSINMFDNKQLEFTKINQIPPNTITINQPNSFYHENRFFFWISLLIFLIMLLLIFTLLFINNKHNKTEIELQKEKSKLEALLHFREEMINTVAVWINTLDKDRKIIIWNKAAENISGYTASEVRNSLIIWEKLYPDEDYRNQIFDKMKRTVYDKKNIVGFQTTITNKSGEKRIISWYSNSIFNNGNFEGIVTFGVDVTNEHNTKIELQKSEKKFKELNELLPEVVFEIDINGRLTYCNQVAFDVFGYTQEDFDTGKTVFEMLEPKDIPKAQMHIKKILETKQSEPTEYTALRSNGDTFPVLIHTVPRFQNGNLVGFRGIITDITEQKAAEEEKMKLTEQLHQSQKMDAIGQLAGGVAHDFNNMLGGIIGSAELIKMKVDSQEVDSYLNMIIKASKRAGYLTKQLLSFSRKGDKSSSNINLEEVINETVNLLSRTIDKSISISVEKNADDSNIIGDDSLLQNCFMNIGINASHAMPDGGELTFSTRNIVLDSNYCSASTFEIKQGKFIEITIRDTGFGMSEQVRQRIFEPFFTTKPQGEGTGLGLSAVYGIVQDHHGAINVYSQIGEGTAFNIYLPISTKKEIATEPVFDIKRGNGSILLIDDEEIIRIVGKAQLEELGYEVILAENGQDGLDKFIEFRDDLDLIILDMIMPVMGGRDCFKKIRDIDAQIPVLIASGFAKEEHIKEMRKKGLNGFLNKPFRIEELSEKLSSFLN